MSQVLRIVRHVVRVVIVAAAVAALGLSSSSVAPVTISLTETRSAKSVDFEEGIVWILVLGSDAAPGQDVRDGDTDAIQLLGMDLATGAATAIGFPRDFYVELPGHDPGRINSALKLGGPELAATVVDTLVHIEPDYVLVTGSDGFLSMVGASDGVTVTSTMDFDADGSSLHVHVGENVFNPQEALDYARTRYALPRGDFDRSHNHQALLLGLLRQLRDHEDEEGFLDKVGVAAIEGLDTDDMSPVDVYRLVQAVTELKPGSTTGCVIGGTDAVVGGNQVVIPDTDQADALGRDAKDDAVLDTDCPG
jgi:polyisoprenyl-teichoic acid--peptidoglycan teichoic acid transferase